MEENQAIATKVANKTKTLCSAVTTAFATAMATPMAFAGGGSSAAETLGTAAEGQLSGGEGVVLGIMVTLIGIVVLFTVYSLIKRAAGKG